MGLFDNRSDKLLLAGLLSNMPGRGGLQNPLAGSAPLLFKLGAQARQEQKRQNQAQALKQALMPQRNQFMQNLLGAEQAQPRNQFMENIIGPVGSNLPEELLRQPQGLLSANPQAEQLVGSLLDAGMVDPALNLTSGLLTSKPDTQVVNIGTGQYSESGQPLLQPTLIRKSDGIPIANLGQPYPRSAGVTVNTGDIKPPTNMQWVDPNDTSKGVVPIPGSVADPNSPSFNKSKMDELRTSSANFESFNNGLDSLEDVVSKEGGALFNQSRRAKISTIITDLQLQIKDLAKLGVLAGPDLDLINNLLIDPSSVRGAILEQIAGPQVFSDNIRQVRQIMTRKKLAQFRQFLPPDIASAIPDNAEDIILKGNDVIVTIDGKQYKMEKQ